MTYLQRIFTLSLLFLFSKNFIAGAQNFWPNPEVETTYNEARQNLSEGKFQQAIMGLRTVIAAAPDAQVAHTDIAKAYLLSGLHTQALAQVNPWIERGEANEQMFQIAAAANTKLDKSKNAEALYLQGLEKYPSSGFLFYEQGKYLQTSGQPEAALQSWIRGVNMDPEFYHNYYEAAYSYFFTKDLVWSILYSEVFLNTEKYTMRASDTRKLLIQAYKKFFTANAGTQLIPEGAATTFEGAVTEGLLRFSNLLADGYTVENLTMMRIRFAMYWKKYYEQKFPYNLFSYHLKLIAEGQFETYNQYLFGQALDKNTFAAWTKMHPQESKNLEDWTKNNRLFMTPTDSYNPIATSNLFQKETKKKSK